ncbi:carbamoyltransferase family protein [Streptomyces sp. 4N509B]|uniref:carbamoyltransferase family protein n=1 Tax=Streptomyces sp. 4N509B TaxID=3457413 RepID=UPI003FD4720C
MSVVLGLCAHTHDSAAALLIDGRLAGFVEEERLSGVKHTRAYPGRAVDWLLTEAGLGPDGIETVAYNFSAPHYLRALPGTAGLLLSADTRGRALPRSHGFATVAARTRRRGRRLAARFPDAAFRPVVHHRSHQTYAFAASGYPEAAVLIVDSLGETQTTTIAHGRVDDRGRPSLRQLRAIHDPASLGYVYGAVTQHLGWRRGDEEGTVMALAALGDPSRFRGLLRRAIRVTRDGFAVHPGLLPPRTLQSGATRLTPAFVAASCPSRQPDAPVEQIHRDLAAALQERTEQVVLHLGRVARRLTGCRRLCLGGGVAANCVAVGRLLDAGVFDQVFVPPAPGDAGTAIGAATAVHLAAGAEPLSGVAGACYLGPRWNLSQLDLARWPELRARRLETDPAPYLADHLTRGHVVGVFHGRVEAGPRALGNRSILASPLSDGVVDRLNGRVKFREPFRPFAPVVPADRASEYFALTQESPFMSIASGVTDQGRRLVPAIVHANGTARVQTVTADHNPLLHAVLHEFGQRTGVPILINTSLNTKGKPICGTPEMALDCLASSGLDALFLEGWWVTR